MSDLIQGDVHQGTNTCVSIQGQREEKIPFCSYRTEKGKKRLHYVAVLCAGKSDKVVFLYFLFLWE